MAYEKALDPKVGNMAISMRRGDEVFIGDDIKITMTKRDGEAFRVVVSAPKSIPIDRKSVRQKKQETERQLAEEFRLLGS